MMDRGVALLNQHYPWLDEYSTRRAVECAYNADHLAEDSADDVMDFLCDSGRCFRQDLTYRPTPERVLCLVELIRDLSYVAISQAAVQMGIERDNAECCLSDYAGRVLCGAGSRFARCAFLRANTRRVRADSAFGRMVRLWISERAERFKTTELEGFFMDELHDMLESADWQKELSPVRRQSHELVYREWAEAQVDSLGIMMGVEKRGAADDENALKAIMRRYLETEGDSVMSPGELYDRLVCHIEEYGLGECTEVNESEFGIIEVHQDPVLFLRHYQTVLKALQRFPEYAAEVISSRKQYPISGLLREVFYDA